MIDYDTPDETWPQKGRGGFWRNFHGQAIVSHPDGGKRTCIYDGASSRLDFGQPYTGDPIHGDRGTHVHSLCDYADHNQPLPDEFIAAGEAIGITAAHQAHIYARWIVYRKAHQFTPYALEAPVVDDGWKVATNIDRVDDTGGDLVVTDIKSSKNPHSLKYVVQLAAGARSVPYDPDTGERGEWPSVINRRVGYLHWYPIADAIKADSWPEWTLIRVDLTDGHRIGNELAAIKAAKVDKDAFTTVPTPSDIAAPTPSHPVEQRAEGGTHGNAAPSATLDEPSSIAIAMEEDYYNDLIGTTVRTSDTTIHPCGIPRSVGCSHPECQPLDATFGAEGLVVAVRPVEDAAAWEIDLDWGYSLTVTDSTAIAAVPQPTLDELRATVRDTFSDADRAALTAYFDANDTDRTDAAQVAEAIAAVMSFHDVAAEPIDRPAPTPAPPPRKMIDEGDTLPEADIAAAGKRYTSLDAEVRSWVTVCGAKVRLSAEHGGQPTVRRFAILRGLCALAEAGFDSDDMVRAICAHLIDSDIAWQAGIAVADLLASLDVTEATRFAQGCDTIAGGVFALNYTLDGRAILSPSLAEVAA